MKKENHLLFTTRALAGNEAKNLMLHFNILAEQKSNLELLTSNTTKSAGGIIKNYTGITLTDVIPDITNFYLEHMKSFSDWEDFYNKVDVSSFKKYSKIFIIGGLDLQNSNLSRFGSRAGVFPKDRDQIFFKSAGRQLCNIVSILKAHHLYGTEIHEISYDPNELILGKMHVDYAPKKRYYAYHGYAIPRYNLKRLDSLQYAFKNEFKMFKEEKLYDLTFGYTSIRGRRDKFEPWIMETFNSFDQATSNLYFRKNIHDVEVNTLIDKDLYLTKLEQSRYTFILPSYDETCFSIYRLIEALHNDCLPIVSPHCKLDEVEESFGISLEPLQLNGPVTETQRLDLLNTYKNIFLPVSCTFF